MALESGTYISQLNSSNPTTSDDVAEGDDHLRLIKAVLKNQFSGLTGTTAISSSEAELNILDGVTATAAELNYLDVTTLGTSADSKALTQASGAVTIAADVTISGTTPLLTIGDAGTEDTMLVFDGNAVDYRVGLDDGTDKLEIGAGSAHGTTTAIAVDSAADMIIGGYINFQDEQAIRPEIKDYAETVNAIGGTGGGTQDIDVTAGNVVTATVDTSTNTFTFSDPSATGKACSFTLILTNGGSQTVNWPSSVDWAGGTAPTLTSSGVDILTFTTVDAGTIWYGFAAGTDMK
jgi:hypothetical protein